MSLASAPFNPNTRHDRYLHICCLRSEKVSGWGVQGPVSTTWKKNPTRWTKVTAELSVYTRDHRSYNMESVYEDTQKTNTQKQHQNRVFSNAKCKKNIPFKLQRNHWMKIDENSKANPPPRNARRSPQANYNWDVLKATPVDARCDIYRMTENRLIPVTGKAEIRGAAIWIKQSSSNNGISRF